MLKSRPPLSSGFLMTDTPAIEMKQIHFSYGAKMVLHDFDLKIERGKVYCLIGSSSSGKTTTLRLMNGLLTAQKGEICIDGKLLDPRQGEKWRRSMGYSIQGSGLFPHMTLEDNLSIIARKESWDKSKISQRIVELCELMDLPCDTSFLKKKPAQISGGQKQRVGIARALFMNPQIMLMDEPFSALDPITRSELQKEFTRLQRQLGLTIVIVTHDLSEAFTMADEMVLLNQGRIEQKDRPSRFLLSPLSTYVEEFIHSHSPGNILKEVYLYSVTNTDTWVATEQSSSVLLSNLESQEKVEKSQVEEAKNYLRQLGQENIFWVNSQGQFLKSQSLVHEEHTHTTCLSSTDHILNGMKTILREGVSALPVVNHEQKLIGVFSEGALDAL